MVWTYVVLNDLVLDYLVLRARTCAVML